MSGIGSNLGSANLGGGGGTTVDFATIAEINAGTINNEAIAPLQLAGSYAGTKSAAIYVVDLTTNLTTGDNKAALVVPTSVNGMNLVSCGATVRSAGTTNTTDIQLRRRRVSTDVDMLSTKITIDSTEYSSITAATQPVINASNDDVITGDLIIVDIDQVSTTAPQGLVVWVEFRLP